MKIDDSIAYRGIFSSVCSKCIHFDMSSYYSCKAFDEIPLEIWVGDNKHIKPYPGDSGIRFAKR